MNVRLSQQLSLFESKPDFQALHTQCDLFIFTGIQNRNISRFNVRIEGIFSWSCVCDFYEKMQEITFNWDRCFIYRQFSHIYLARNRTSYSALRVFSNVCIRVANAITVTTIEDYSNTDK